MSALSSRFTERAKYCMSCPSASENKHAAAVRLGEQALWMLSPSATI